MDREAVNKIIKSLRASYPNAYKGFDRPMFVELCDRMEKAFERFPNEGVIKAYDTWIANTRYAPKIAEILGVLTREYPLQDKSHDPSTWETYEDERGYEFVIVPESEKERLGLAK